MNRIPAFFGRGAFFAMAIVLALIALAPASHAQSAAKAEKHARKIERRLAKYRAGATIKVDFRDDSQAIGLLHGFNEANFQIANSDSNKLQTFQYADVTRVKKTREYIGAGSEPGHHMRLWVPLAVVAVAAGGGVAAYEAVR